MLQRATFQAVQTQLSAGQHISVMPALGRQRREGHLQCKASWYTPSLRTVRARETVKNFKNERIVAVLSTDRGGRASKSNEVETMSTKFMAEPPQSGAEVKIQSYTWYLAENMIEHSTILSSEENGSLLRGQGPSPSIVLPTLPSRVWRSCHTSKWLWVAHQKKCRGPLLCPHDQPKSSTGTSLDGSRSWLCYHRHPWAGSLRG